MNVKNEIKSAFKNNKRVIYISVAVLVISLILGYVLEPYLYSFMNPVVDNFSKNVQSGNIKLTFVSIFSNNLRVIFLMFILGIFFCISLLMLAFNGFFVGYYVGTSDKLLTVLLLIIPHGVFELPSCTLACASGIVIFKFVVKFIRNLVNQKDKSFSERVNYSARESFDKLKEAVILFLVASVLMVIAGIFEVYLTVPIAKFVLSALG